MTQSIDFNTANDLAKFLSDKLGNNPSPAKILHWISEYQGFRNAKALKAEQSTYEQGGSSRSASHEGADIPSYDYRQGEARIQFKNQVYLMAHDFLMSHRGDLLSAFQTKKDDSEFDLEQALYTEAWEDVESYTDGLPTKVHCMILSSAISHTTRENIKKRVLDIGMPDTDSNVCSYAYEEATKDVIVTFLRNLDEDMSIIPFHPSDLKDPESSVIWTYLEKASESATAWVE